MSETAPISAADDPNLDLYCLECGYNLRGLPGDPRRCPECGVLNPMSDLTIPAEHIRKQLEVMESSLAWLGLCILVAVGTTIALAATLWSGFISPALPTLLLLIIIAGVACVHSFRKSCRARTGWFEALVQYQLVAAGLMAAILAPLILATLAGIEGSLKREWILPIVAAVLVIWIVIMAVVAPRVHRSLRATIDPLQREVAVQIARDQLRRRLYNA